MTSKVQQSKHGRKRYKKPKLQHFGHMSRVTQKTGLNLDSNMATKPGGGGG
ncbi:MAG: hypothetical protein OER96_10600 [Gammaproteobacteria bacterium]|nr:hypothetical protein [Gammaproteobacteria bacterium]